MPRNKKPKRKLALKMMSKKEIINNISPFSCKNWLIRVFAKRQKELLKSKKK